MSGRGTETPTAPASILLLASLRTRLSSHVRVPMYREAYALILSGVITSLVGVAYWVVAAHSYAPDVVGLNSVAISAMMLLAGVSQLNLASALTRFVPVSGKTSVRLVFFSYLASVLLAAALSAVFLVGVHRWLPSLNLIGETFWLGLLFVCAAMAWCIFVLQDAVLTGLRRAIWVPVENAAFSLTKLVLLVLFAGLFPRYGIFTSWTTAVVVTLVPVTALIFGRLLPRHVDATGDRASPPPLRQLTRFVAADYLGALCWLASVTVVPIIVTLRVGPAENAYFSLAWVMVVPFFLVGASMGSSLVVSAVSDPGMLPRYLSRMLTQTAILVLPVVAVLEIGAPYLLRIFGSSYSEHGTTVLRLLALSAVPNFVNTLYVSSARVRQQMSSVVAVLAAECLGVLALSWVLLGPYGIEGVGWAWLVSQTLVAAAVAARTIPGLRRATSAAATAGWTAGLRVAFNLADDLGLLLLVRRCRGAIEGKRRLRGLRPLLAEALTSVPETAGAAPPRGWSTRRIGPTVSDTIVLSGASLRETPRVALKLPCTSVGSQSLSREIEVLSTLWREPRLADWSAILPRVLAAGETAGRAYLVEELIPGVDARRLFVDSDRRRAVQERSAAAIGDLHRLTAAPRIVDDELIEVWVDRPLLALARVQMQVGRASLERVAAELRASFAGRTLSLSWIHGDFVPGNVLAVPDASRLTGIVDWDRAMPDDLPLLDLLQFLLSARALVTRREFGSVVVGLLEGASFDQDEQALLADAQASLPGDAIDLRAAVLLCWLRHVSANLEKSTRYARHYLWLRANVLSVLDRVA